MTSRARAVFEKLVERSFTYKHMAWNPRELQGLGLHKPGILLDSLSKEEREALKNLTSDEVSKVVAWSYPWYKNGK